MLYGWLDSGVIRERQIELGIITIAVNIEAMWADNLA